MVINAYWGLLIWDYLHQQVVDLARLKDKYSKAILPGRDLPQEYLTALLVFKSSLDIASQMSISQMKQGFPASPGFRSLFVREPHVAGSDKIKTNARVPVKDDPMLWVFQAIIDDTQRHLFGLPGLVDELDRTIQTDPKAKERISTWLANLYSELGVIAASMHQIEIYQPWAAAMEMQEAEMREEIDKINQKHLAKVSELAETLEDTDLLKTDLGLNRLWTEDTPILPINDVPNSMSMLCGQQKRIWMRSGRHSTNFGVPRRARLSTTP